jgi:hypothetical protein
MSQIMNNQNNKKNDKTDDKLHDKCDNKCDDKCDDKKTYKTHRSGNTFRQKGHNHSYVRDIAFEGDNVEMIDNHGKILEVPVSDLEIEFPEMLKILLSKLNSNFFCKSHENFMNRTGLWTIQDFLETKSTKKENKTYISCGVVRHENTYEMPIVEFKKIPVKDGLTLYKDRDKFEWNGIVYQSDPDIIYEFKQHNYVHGESTKSYIRSDKSLKNHFGKYYDIDVAIRYEFADLPSNVTRIDFNITYNDSYPGCNPKRALIDNGRIWNSKTKKLVKPDESSPKFGSNLHHWNYMNNGYWRPNESNKKSHVILDMGKPTKVKYISTLGRPPICSFYPKDDRERIIDGKRFDKILIVDSAPREYVTKYSLHGRTEHGKWIFIGNYTGNCDPYVEKINDLTNDLSDSIKYRYLKVEPLSHYDAPSMRFMLFGDIADIPEQVVLNEVPEKIKYTITHASKEKFIRDGRSSGYKGCYFDGFKKENYKKICGKITHMYNNYREEYEDNFGQGVL